MARFRAHTLDNMEKILSDKDMQTRREVVEARSDRRYYTKRSRVRRSRNYIHYRRKRLRNLIPAQKLVFDVKLTNSIEYSRVTDPDTIARLTKMWDTAFFLPRFITPLELKGFDVSSVPYWWTSRKEVYKPKYYIQDKHITFQGRLINYEKEVGNAEYFRYLYESKNEQRKQIRAKKMQKLKSEVKEFNLLFKLAETRFKEPVDKEGRYARGKNGEVVIITHHLK